MSAPGGLRLFDGSRLAATAEAARSSARRRANLNVHPSLEDPVQRFLNVFQPGTYVRPHRHEPHRFELFLVLGGRAGVLAFHDDGRIVESAVVSRDGVWAAEVPGGAWHTVVSLAPDTMLFEIKPGPFRPMEEKDFAPWAPREGASGARDVLELWEKTLGGAVSDPRG